MTTSDQGPLTSWMTNVQSLSSNSLCLVSRKRVTVISTFSGTGQMMRPRWGFWMLGSQLWNYKVQSTPTVRLSRCLNTLPSSTSRIKQNGSDFEIKNKSTQCTLYSCYIESIDKWWFYMQCIRQFQAELGSILKNRNLSIQFQFISGIGAGIGVESWYILYRYLLLFIYIYKVYYEIYIILNRLPCRVNTHPHLHKWKHA